MCGVLTIFTHKHLLFMKLTVLFHAAYSSSPESILKWTKEISPLEGVEVGGWCTPLHIGWAQLGGGGGAAPPTLDGHSWMEWEQLGGGWCISHGLKVSWGWRISRLLR